MDLSLKGTLHGLSLTHEKNSTLQDNGENNKGKGLLERQEGGSADATGVSGDFDLKRSRGSSGEHTGPGSKNKALEDLEECLKGLMISQMRDCPVFVEGGILPLLNKCLCSSPEGARFVVVEGITEHFESKKDVDEGWGCGWRNIQMLVSNLLSEDAEAKEALFGGAGYVPDIPALQQWLEIAWAKGFDVPGGEYFDWKIKGTNKWIGTTEGAALLRSFGVRAYIVDFQATGGKREQPGQLRVKAGQGSSATDGKESGSEESEPQESVAKIGEEDENVENDGMASEPRRTAPDCGVLDKRCIVCGEHKIQDPEFRRDNKDSDMCPKCMKMLQDSGTNDQNTRVIEQETQITGRHRQGWDDKTGGGGSEVGYTTIKHQHMMEWVWKYFTADLSKSTTCKKSNLLLSKRSPLYFQHRGHSQTIVGIECRKVSKSPDSEEMNLLVLDPSEQSNDIINTLRSDAGWEKLVKRGLQTMKQTEYQLCYADRGIAKGKELDNLKILTSKSYTY